MSHNPGDPRYDLQRRLYGIGAEEEEQVAPPIGQPQADLTVRDEGVPQSSSVDDIDFVGDGVVGMPRLGVGNYTDVTTVNKFGKPAVFHPAMTDQLGSNTQLIGFGFQI